ncbi:hypothetical protein pEaSNUABM11_00126 [Erwinia phage pEa_SNUABM_11]|nr:hypothetical protein pEaSNUABM11_00126 [Erwinia phage pEa_SNUABM_11]
MGIMSKLFGTDANKTVANPLDNVITADPKLGFFGEEVARIGVELSHAHSRKDGKVMARCLAALRELNTLNIETGYKLAMPKHLNDFRVKKARGEMPFLHVK